MIILDTCALVWMVNCPGELSKAAASAIRTHAETLCILPISAWEIAVKIQSGKLAFHGTLTTEDWYAKVVESYGLHEVPLTADLLCASARLPIIHRDPCDRMVIAAAMRIHAPIVTADSAIAQYPGITTIW